MRKRVRSFFSISLASLINPGVTTHAFGLQRNHRACVTADVDDQWTEVAKRIADELKLPYMSLDDEIDEALECSHILDVVTYGDTYALGIRPMPSTNTLTTTTSATKRRQKQPRILRRTAGSPLPFIVDFLPSQDSRIANRVKSKSDMLIKAVAPNKVPGGARVLDLTAGFGQDSLLMLENGASAVHMVERDPVVASLLQDALRRRSIAIDPSIDRLSLSVGNGLDIMKSIPGTVDVCYLDPMFPPRTKSAAVKKNMQILHSLLESQQQHLDDQVDLLESALWMAQSRVVVKRPIHAVPLGNGAAPKPSFEIRGSVNRFDVYVAKS
jgi:16S rRNA (guanine1516-N2)-methyltransferase